jgi:peptidoglycan/xylan/chitin deacetylase (PgdA/CDA1 family)
VRAILTYHSIDDSGSPISIDRECFARHVRFMTSPRVRVVPLAQIENAHGDALAVTFDDGFLDFADQAWPLLREHGLPATLFVVSGQVGQRNDWGGKQAAGIPTLPLCDWDALGRMAAEGLELGAHSRLHPHLEELDDSDQSEEIEGCADDIERRTGHAPRSFCYPFGSFDERALARVRARYARACTTELDLLRGGEDAHLLPRLDAFYYRAPGRLEAWGTGAFRRHLWLRRLGRAVKGRLRG